MPTAFRVRRRRLLVVGLGAALLVPLSMGPAGAQAPAMAGGSAAPAAGAAVVGKLVRAVADPRMSAARKDAPRTKPLTWIEPAHGPAVRVPSDQVAHLPLGATVKVTLGAKVTDASPGPSTQEPARQVLAAAVVSPAAAPAVATATPDDVTVVKVHPRNSDGSPDTTPDSTTMTDLLADLNGPVATYWRNESQGAVELHAAAAPDEDNWYTPASATATCSNAEALWSDVATHVGFTPGPNKHLFLYLPSMPDNPTALPDCEYGLGTVGSSLHDGGYAYVRDTLTSVMAHELGHNFGLGHSSEYQCDRSVVNGTCGFADYYDLYDVMGASFEQLGSLSAPQANLIGVLPSDQVADLSGHTPGTNTVTLTPIGVHTATKRAIKLGASDGLTYWLEYRSAVGQDSWLGDSTLNTPHLDQGVVIRAEASGLEDASYGDTSLLLDATPSPQAGWEADDQEALKAGRSVYLSSLDYYVTVKSATTGPSGTAVVQVQAGDAPLSRDLDRNYHADLEIADSSGNLYMYPSAPGGGFGTRTVLGRGWQTRDLIVMAGDFDGSGNSQDLIARNPANGDLWLYSGNGHGGFVGSRVIGRGWQTANALFSPGDWNGDGTPDLILRRRSDGALVLYPGDGAGGFKTPAVISNANWNVMSSLVPTGDLDSNGTTDFVARGTDGTVYLYNGNGSGGFAGRVVLGHGWQSFTSITGVGDWDGDGLPDLLDRKSDGTLWLYSGTGDGHFLAPRKVGTGLGAARFAV